MTRSLSFKDWLLAFAYAATWSLAGASADSVAATSLPVTTGYRFYETSLGGSFARIFAIDQGHAVGSAEVPGGTNRHAFLWTARLGTRDLGTLGGTTSTARAVDGWHVVGGASVSGDAALHVFSWKPLTGMVDLGTLGGTYGLALAVHGDEVVGESTTASGDIHAFRWTPATGMVDLGVLPGGTESDAVVIENHITAGWSATNGYDVGSRHPVYWDANDGLHEIVATRGQSTAMRDGRIVGYYFPDADHIRAFSFRRTGALLDLGLPATGGFTDSFAWATDGRRVVGGLNTDFEHGYQIHSFVWESTTGIEDIGSPGGASEALFADHGLVVGYFIRSPQGGYGTYVWTRERGMRDASPPALVFGARPAGLDTDGRIAVNDEQDDAGITRAGVLVPR